MFRTARTSIAIVLLFTAITLIALFTLMRGDQIDVDDLLASLDQNCLGCGPDAYLDKIIERPMAFALLASVGYETNDQKLTKQSANWLVTHAHPRSEAVGWGLGFSWDAFNDGSENPADTVYGITTALAVRGLFDAYEYTGEVRYRDTAMEALDYYSRFFTKTVPGGFFWYSDQSADAIDVHNVSSMLVGQFARAAALTGNRRFRELADAALADLLANRRNESGYDYWWYSPAKGYANDSVHAAYTVQGILDYDAATDEKIATPAMVSYLTTFLVDGRVSEFSPIHQLPAKLSQRPARLWGVGMLMFTLADAGEIASARALRKATLGYADNGGFSNTPGEAPVSEPRMVAHAALGVARLKR